MNEHDTGNDPAWPDGPPRDTWHSFNSTPWLHPWLTRHNLRAMREASAAWREEAHRVVERADRVPNHFAFVGNMANGMYMPAKPLARTGAEIEVFGLSGDDSIFSDARWEEYDGVLPEGVSYLRDDRSRTFLDGVQTPVPFFALETTEKWAVMQESDVPPYARIADFRRWPGYFANIPALERLQAFDAVFTAQAPYIPYLSGRPYVASQTGGDIWLKSSRDDALGRLQQISFARAGCVVVTTPWIFAHGRRYGMTNFLYLPFIIDERDYSPGPPEMRNQWEAASGGNFFVLSTARADDHDKGPQIGLRGFAEFARRVPGARLVVTAWGKDIEAVKRTVAQLDISDRVLFVPVSGKRKLVKYLRSADCLLDQFIVGYYGVTALEAAASGTPVIMRLEQAQYDALFEGGAPPFLNAATSSEVTNALEFLATDTERRSEISAKNRHWFMRNHSGERWAADYRAVLAAVALGHRFSFDKSPLAADLSPAERLYHFEQLASAPPFPNYNHTDGLGEVQGHLRLIDSQLSSLVARIDEFERRYVTLRNGASYVLDPFLKIRRWLTSGSAGRQHSK